MSCALTRVPRAPVAAVLLAAVVLVAAACAAPVCAQTNKVTIIGPYLQNVGTDNATVCWATVPGLVGLNPPRWDKIATYPAYEHHSVLLRELTPGTTYAYDVLGDGTDFGRGTLATVPQREQPFHFVVTGDTQSSAHMRPGVHRQLVERMIAEKPDLAFNTGDLVDEGADVHYWEVFFQDEGALLRNVPLYPALGNHERDAKLYFDFFSLPGNERYYSFNRGAAHFVVLDAPGPESQQANQPETPEDLKQAADLLEEYWRKQIEWFKRDLENSRTAKYVFVFFHYPVYTMSTGDQEEAAETRGRFGSIFQDYGVSAVFNGHTHVYHHALAGGVHFVLAGMAAGDANREALGPPLPETVKHARASDFVRVDVGPERAQVRVIGVDGDTVDEFEIAARPTTAPTGH